MSPLHRHWLEKAQVQITAAAALAVGWFACWHVVSPWDPHGALTFLPDGHIARLAAYAGMVWAMAVGCALLTLPAPPEGALLATLVGAAGMSLRSGPMQMLLWRWESDLGGLSARLALEVAAMAAVVAGATALIALLRALARRFVPNWVWSARTTEGRASPAQQTGARQEKTSPAAQMAGAALMELAVAVILLVFAFRSTDRGQIAFALAVSFFVAALTAHYTFPVRSSVPFWAGPIVMGLVVFAIGLVGVGSAPGPAWHNAMVVAKDLRIRAALPADWLALGCGGAVAGFWLSRRIHHGRSLRKEAGKERKGA